MIGPAISTEQLRLSTSILTCLHRIMWLLRRGVMFRTWFAKGIVPSPASTLKSACAAWSDGGLDGTGAACAPRFRLNGRALREEQTRRLAPPNYLAQLGSCLSANTPSKRRQLQLEGSHRALAPVPAHSAGAPRCGCLRGANANETRVL